MLSRAVELSLIISAIHMTTMPGMIFYKASRLIEKLIYQLLNRGRIQDMHRHAELAGWICKPLFGCVICMASFWTVTLCIWSTPVLEVTRLIFLVCGLNIIMSLTIKKLLYE